MTPFGIKMRELRRARSITLKRMAEDLQISPAYLSALEHGHRGRPSPVLLRQICSFFNVIWDEAEELQRLAAISHPRIVVDTAGLSPKATELANRMAERIGELDEATLEAVLDLLKKSGPLKS
jgi:transcriptional regulator with XRE-family HTH domain